MRAALAGPDCVNSNQKQLGSLRGSVKRQALDSKSKFRPGGLLVSLAVRLTIADVHSNTKSLKQADSVPGKCVLYLMLV